MLLFLADLIDLTKFSTFFEFATYTFTTSPVRLKTILTIKIPTTLIAKNLSDGKHGKIQTRLVLSVAGTAVLPHTVVILRCFMIVALLTVTTVEAPVE